EKDQIINEFNDTKTVYPRNKSVSELFEEQVKNKSNNIALIYEGKELTYSELNFKANQIARALRKKGVEVDEPVGVMMESGFEGIASILGVLKAGGAYLPIDVDYPKERVRYMLEDSRANIVLTKKHLSEKLGFVENKLLVDSDEILMEDGSNLDCVNKATDLIYIIYTSGSTGKPKGVAVEHRNVVRLVKNTNFIKFDEQDRMLQTSTIVFDASTLEIWGSLLNGMRLYLTNKETILSAERLSEIIKEEKITTMWLTAPLFRQIAEEKPDTFLGLKYLLSGGDILPVNQINKVRNICRGIKVINGYGPTENTTFSTCYPIEKEYETSIPIGYPISNSTAYIFDQYENIQPIGAVGELYVGGDGIARGYLNNPELTERKFVPNPFAKGERLYRTGDLVRWLPGGEIEFLGRIDNQVKIRGFRIEPGEIEKHLLRHEEIKAATVLCRDDKKGANYLCAYIVCVNDIKVTEVRQYLLKEQK
ncbi:MAG: non-ribosomal peptide synthetase, partial [Clostridiaceae bacterium]|nr:non-ribosomal peptide synthetase [Clostridiaceae bacterium]